MLVVSKRILDQTATGDCDISILSRAGVFIIDVSVQKKEKNSKNNRNQYRNVAEKKGKNRKKNYKY